MQESDPGRPDLTTGERTKQVQEIDVDKNHQFGAQSKHRLRHVKNLIPMKLLHCRP